MPGELTNRQTEDRKKCQILGVCIISEAFSSEERVRNLPKAASLLFRKEEEKGHYTAPSDEIPTNIPTMSQCPHCFVGQCQKHKLQDHGRREAQIKAKMMDPKATQRKLYAAIVTKQLDRLEAAARSASASEQVRFDYITLVLRWRLPLGSGKRLRFRHRSLRSMHKQKDKSVRPEYHRTYYCTNTQVLVFTLSGDHTIWSGGNSSA